MNRRDRPARAGDIPGDCRQPPLGIECKPKYKRKEKRKKNAAPKQEAPLHPRKMLAKPQSPTFQHPEPQTAQEKESIASAEIATDVYQAQQFPHSMKKKDPFCAGTMPDMIPSTRHADKSSCALSGPKQPSSRRDCRPPLPPLKMSQKGIVEEKAPPRTDLWTSTAVNLESIGRDRGRVDNDRQGGKNRPLSTNAGSRGAVRRPGKVGRVYEPGRSTKEMV